MTRREHLEKAEDHLCQVIAHLQAAGVPVGRSWTCETALEAYILELIEAEPRGEDTDYAYEQMVDDEMGCM
jgi:hypothetical protein